MIRATLAMTARHGHTRPKTPQNLTCPWVVEALADRGALAGDGGEAPAGPGALDLVVAQLIRVGVGYMLV